MVVTLIILLVTVIITLSMIIMLTLIILMLIMVITLRKIKLVMTIMLIIIIILILIMIIIVMIILLKILLMIMIELLRAALPSPTKYGSAPPGPLRRSTVPRRLALPYEEWFRAASPTPPTPAKPDSQVEKWNPSKAPSRVSLAPTRYEYMSEPTFSLGNPSNPDGFPFVDIILYTLARAPPRHPPRLRTAAWRDAK